MTAIESTTWQADFPIHLARTLAPFKRGGKDPTYVVDAERSVWRTALLPDGPATYRISQTGPTTVRAQAWGPGARQALELIPGLMGAGDCPERFDPVTDRVRQWAQQLGEVRVPRSGLVAEALIPGILEQRVIGVDAFDAWRYFVRTFGTPAPGPTPVPMMVMPSVETWRTIPSWHWHRARVDPARAAAVMRVLPHVGKLQRAADAADSGEVYRLLQLVPGVGVWTAAQVGHRALGDADAIPLRDYHIGRIVGWALCGKVIDLDDVPPVVAPWAPHRYRLWRILELTPGTAPPRRGPRLTRQDHRFH